LPDGERWVQTELTAAATPFRDIVLKGRFV
jgi:hypothetical protein